MSVLHENQVVELKESWRDEYLKWICGFANGQGGRLVIGIDDAGNPVGLPNAERLLVDLPNRIRDMLGIIVDVNLKSADGRPFIEIDVEPYPYPVSYRGRYYLRSGSTKQELKGAALDKFLLGKQGKHWDEVPVPHAALAQLDAEAIDSFRHRASQSKRMLSSDLQDGEAALLDKLKLTEGDYLKRACLLLFHPDPERYVTGASIKIGFFRSDADLRFQDEVHGNLFEQVDTVMELLLTKYTEAAISYRGAQRIETYPVPEGALREALHNAVVHKDYAAATPIQISVYADRLMLWNPGQLPAEWTVRDLLRKHASRPHNPTLANTFFRAGMIEAWGRGIERIFQACQSEGKPKPELRVDHAGVWVVFRFPKVGRETGGVDRGTTPKTTSKTTPKTPPITPPSTSRRIVDILRDHPTASRSQLAEMLGDITLDGVRYHLKKLRGQGVIRHVGPSRGGHWEVLEEVSD